MIFMVNIIKNFQVVELDDGTTRVISSDKKQMARWYALDYLKDKPQKSQQEYYMALLSGEYYFSGGFRKRKK